MKARSVKMLLALVCFALVCSTLALAADPPAVSPKVTFAKSFPGSAPPFFSVTIERAGAATYNESDDPDNAEKIKLEPALVNRIFDLADKLDHFNNPLESGLKVANMGMKTVRWENGDQKQETKFNYSTSEDAKTLTDLFERVAESTRMLVDLNRAIRHDRLGVNDAILRIAVAWDAKRLVATPQYLPVLDQVAANEAFIHMARERAARIADAIRAMQP